MFFFLFSDSEEIIIDSEKELLFLISLLLDIANKSIIKNAINTCKLAIVI